MKTDLGYIGEQVEAARSRLGLSRGELAARLGVTVQTIMNIERDSTYNLGTRLMRQIEVALQGKFCITFTEEGNMNDRIRIGNDELILYIRKNHDCHLSNDQLGRRIWVWLRDNAAGRKLVEDQLCRWGAVGSFIGDRDLPKTATQFEFRTSALPDLYRFLDQLGREGIPAAATGLAPTPIENYRVGEFTLVIDLLGTAVRMADSASWLESCLEILDVIEDVLNATTNMANPGQSRRVFQHGDTLVFPSDDIARLIPLGMELMTRFWDRDILAQASIAAGGAYFITDPGGFGSQKRLHPNASLQPLVGPAVARSHLALRGVKGPRFVLDEETVRVSPAPGVWRRYLGDARRRVDPGCGVQVSEVAWWQYLGDHVDHQLEERLRNLDRTMCDAGQRAPGSPVKPLWERDIASMEKRLEHLQAFARILKDDPF